MPCDRCRDVPVPTGRFEKIALNIERHAALYRCKSCGTLYELVAEDKAIPELTWAEARRRFPDLPEKLEAEPASRDS